MIGTNEQWALVPVAEAIAREAHANQLRKFKNVDYITHPEAVAALVKYPNQKVVAWLHDVLEDCKGWTPDRLHDRGIPWSLVHEITILTKREGESYYDFIMRIIRSGSGLATIVKIADIDHNLSDLNPLSLKGLRDKYLLARHILTENLL